MEALGRWVPLCPFVAAVVQALPLNKCHETEIDLEWHRSETTRDPQVAEDQHAMRAETLHGCRVSVSVANSQFLSCDS